VDSVDDSVAVEPGPAPPPRGRVARVLAARRRLPENVRILSWVSLANDSASELAYPVLPLFVTITLAAPVYLVGVIEGIAEATALVVRLFSGWISDRQGGRRKPWITSGYGLAAVARTLVAAAPAWGWVLAGRVVDRFGKGARSTPRDALIRDSTPPPLMGAAFGYHRGMDTVGAVIGPLVAVILLELGLSLREILWFAVVPGLFTLLLLRRLREAPASSPHARAEAAEAEAPAERVSALPASFWTVLAIWVVFSLGNSSDAFLLLRSHNLGLSTLLVVLAYAVYNVVSASLSWPFGHLSDRIPRAWVLGIGTVAFGLVYLGFALASRPWAAWPLLAFYGVYVAATEGVGRAWVADHVRSGSVGTAYGVFYAATAGAALIASLVAGILWTYVSPKAPFVLGACTAAAATVLLGAHAVSAGLGPRAARILLAAITVGIAVAAVVERNNLGDIFRHRAEVEVPLAAARPCGAAPRTRIAPTLPDRFPSPGHVAYIAERRAGPTHIVQGFVPTGVDGAHDAYLSAFRSAGYVILREELDPADSEVDFRRAGVTGEVKLVQECRGRTHVRITIRPA
jgi:MFS family permease